MEPHVGPEALDGQQDLALELDVDEALELVHSDGVGVLVFAVTARDVHDLFVVVVEETRDPPAEQTEAFPGLLELLGERVLVVLVLAQLGHELADPRLPLSG